MQHLDGEQQVHVLLQTCACGCVRTFVLAIGRCLLSQQARPQPWHPSAHFPLSFLPSPASFFINFLIIVFIIIPSNHRFSLLLTPLSPFLSLLTDFTHRSSFLCCRESGVARFEIGLNDRQNACKHKQMFLKSYVLINTSTRPDKFNAHSNNKHPCKPRKHRTKDVCANRKLSCVIILCHIFLRRKVFQHLQVSCTFETVSWC